MYQCQMGKQTMGIPSQTLPYRADNKLYVLNGGQVMHTHTTHKHNTQTQHTNKHTTHKHNTQHKTTAYMPCSKKQALSQENCCAEGKTNERFCAYFCSLFCLRVHLPALCYRPQWCTAMHTTNTTLTSTHLATTPSSASLLTRCAIVSVCLRV